uniref:Uncharacterized protein n=1 Tax=Mustela putorius furo TaxID=9669 RepID=M3Z2T4_MUSPF
MELNSKQGCLHAEPVLLASTLCYLPCRETSHISLGLFLTPRRSTAKTTGPVVLRAWTAEKAKVASRKEHEESVSQALGQQSLFDTGLQTNYKFTLISNVREKLII